MASLIFDGYYDTLRHSPSTLMVFHAMDLSDTLHFPKWDCNTIYVHDTRHPNGRIPQGTADNAFVKVRDAIPVLRARIAEASQSLLMWPEGRDNDRCRHVAGGGWATNGATFYIARSNANGRWCKYLCANVQV
jgi:hypothetical protein